MANWVLPAIHTTERLQQCFRQIRALLAPEGRLVATVNHPDFIHHRHKFYETVVGTALCAGEVHPTRLLDSAGQEVLVTSDAYWPTTTIVECALVAGLVIVESRDIYDPVETLSDAGRDRVPAYQALGFEAAVFPGGEVNRPGFTGGSHS